MLYAVLILSVTNLVTLIALGVVTSKKFVHKHAWDAWTEWIEDVNYYNDRQLIRYRVCDTCTRVERQKTGFHKCHVKPSHNCPHLSKIMENGPMSRITRLEKDLGIDGQV